MSDLKSTVLKICDPTIQPQVCAFFMSCSNKSSLPITSFGPFTAHEDLVKLHSEICVDILTDDFSRAMLSGYNSRDFELIRQYMYTGQIDIPKEDALQTNDLATTLRIESLMKIIAAEIKFDVYPDDMFVALKNSSHFNNPYMKAAVLKKLCESFDTIDFDLLFKNIHLLQPDMMAQVLQCEKAHTNAKSELILAQLLSKWNNAIYVCPALKSHIKFELINPYDLITKVKDLQILTDAEYTALLEKMLMKSTSVKIYICNVRNSSVPDGYRIITSEEFNTDEFKQFFLAQIKKGFKCIGDNHENNGFLVTASRGTIRYIYNINIKCLHGKFVCMTHCASDMTNVSFLNVNDAAPRSNSDAYICVKK
jgi:hypothetical protein